MPRRSVMSMPLRDAEEPVRQLARALGATIGIVDAVRAEQWSAPTPCPDWSVRDVVEHLIRRHLQFANIVSGRPGRYHMQSPPRSRSAGAVVPPDDGLPAEHAASAFRLVQAFELPHVLEHTVKVPIGQVPGIIALHIRLVEALAHGWDIAVATGQRRRLPPDLAVQETELVCPRLASLPVGLFGPPRQAPPDSPAIDRLAALLGRDVVAALKRS
ncbi:MAG: TIGR03086 family metal-binding protein [Candidatus Dormibacteraceae bacterium]